METLARQLSGEVNKSLGIVRIYVLSLEKALGLECTGDDVLGRLVSIVRV